MACEYNGIVSTEQYNTTIALNNPKSQQTATILIPAENEIDLKDVPEEVLSQLKVIPVETIEDVLREALGIVVPKIEHISSNINVGEIFHGSSMKRD